MNSSTIPLPPSDIRRVDDETFEKEGKKGINIFRRHGLRPDQRVLDVGCGAGRHARALLEYLDRDRGAYCGVDVNKDKIAWCQDNLAPLHPNFEFRYLDVRSERFNPNGSVAIEHFRFPFAPGSFDFVIYWSVFTHMLPDVMLPYLRDTCRVLKPGGKIFITFFLWTSDTQELIRSGNPRFRFEHDHGIYRLHREDQPEFAVAYDSDYIDGMFKEHGLIVESRQLGDWRTVRSHGQDILVVKNASH